ncbi:MAG: LAGLIDADG family homing endonuclease [Tetrasphaera sp.]
MTETARSGSARSSKPKGLTIERIHTIEGVHPYDEVTWEKRDVTQSNWKTGEVIFDQRGVEFPNFWSVNASTIVTTKYFRGAVGTPARESSLRQLIDRVVLTYTKAGREHGYFATDQDAEIFEHELTYALLHQVFSFNSPVWFNVGTKSPQQVSACQPYDAPVSTPAGLVPIGQLVRDDAVGMKVHDAHGITRIVATKANGVKDVLRVHTKAGYVLDVTADHLVWKTYATGSGGRFVEAGSLGPGDMVEWHRREAFGEDEILGREIAEAALAGWLQSDGFVGQYAGTNRSLTIEAMTVTPAELAWVTDALDVVFPEVHRHERKVTTQDESLDCRRTRLYGTGLTEFIDAWGLRTRGNAMEVPQRLFTAPLPVVAAYLRSIFQAEGFVSARERSTVVEVDMVGEAHIRGMQALLLRFGIFARVGFKADRRPDRQGTWTLRIQNAGDRRLFADAIGFIDPVKADKLEASFEKPGRGAAPTKVLQIDRIEARGPMEVYDIQTESGEYLSGNLRVHNCFILSVDDSMDSILNWYKEEGFIFKGGSGAGLNLSRIRSSKELLSSGGTASGPVSFMRGADASAGTIKSGGATRRAAKMVVLDVDHPDIEEFVSTKAREEDKIRALRDAGFDMDLGGKDIVSVQYQNANNSVRVTDEFMSAVESDSAFGLRARMSGEVIEEVDARTLMRSIAQAAWECADPGIQYDDTINGWHTNPETGRITASNPCFTRDTLVHTDRGLIRFDELLERTGAGEEFAVYTHDATNPDAPAAVMQLTSPKAWMITGRNPIVRLRFNSGLELRCTPTHRIWTTNRGYVEAQGLTADDKVLALDLPTPAVNASWTLPEAARLARIPAPGERQATLDLPEEWSADLAHYLGWLIGGGSTSSTVSTIYGSAEDRTEILPRHEEFLAAINAGRALKLSEQANGTAQLRLGRGQFFRFLAGLGVTRALGAEKVLPAAIMQAPTEISAEFLRGLFDADGTAVRNETKGSYAGLGSASRALLIDVQRLLSTFGISSRIYQILEASDDGYRHTRADGSTRRYRHGAGYDLRITGRSLDVFAAQIGFTLSRKAATLSDIITSRTAYVTDRTVRLTERTDEGIELTYNLSEPRNHSYVANGVVVRNCSEYMSLDNSSCNLASLNLLKFLGEDETFDAERFQQVVELVITAMDISISFADFPTEAIGATTRDYRQLGVGYANLGALLMATGHGYDSEGGRALAAAITSLMTGAAYKRSTELAAVVGPYSGYARNADAHKRVMRKHQAANDALRTKYAMDEDIHRHATRAWDAVIKGGEKNGFRNAQASLLAPTGCLTGDTLITTDRGLQRLCDLGDVWGEKWQDVDLTVSTDEGPRTATKFFVNGEEPTRKVVTKTGYSITGTLAHRIKIVDPVTGAWVWKRMAEVAPGDLVPMQLDTLVGDSREVPLPVLDQVYYTGDHDLVVPSIVDAELAELVGYFMGDGSLHAKGIRLCVADGDADVIDRIGVLAKGLFNLQPVVTAQQGYQEVTLQSVRLARWWTEAGFAKNLPGVDHSGKGWTPRIPAAILETNDRSIYAAFLRGLFEADGTVLDGVPTLSSASPSFAGELRTVLLALGYPSTTRTTRSGSGRSDPRGAVAQRPARRALRHADRFHGRAQVRGSWRASVDHNPATATASTSPVTCGSSSPRSARRCATSSVRRSPAVTASAETPPPGCSPRPAMRASATPSASSTRRWRPMRTAVCSRHTTSPCPRMSPMSPPDSSATTPSVS